MVATVAPPTIDSIYREIIQLSVSVGECRAGIELTQDLIQRMYYELKKQGASIAQKVEELEKKEAIRVGHSKFLWKLINISPTNIIKWFMALILAGSIFNSINRLDLADYFSRLSQIISG